MAKKPSVPIDGTFEPAPKDDRIWQEKLRDGGNDWINYLLGPHAQTAADAASFLPSQAIVDLLSGSGEVSKGVVNKNPWESGMGLVNMLTSGAPGPSISPAMILALPKTGKNRLNELYKMKGNKDLFEMFDKEGAWLDPNNGLVKTMLGEEQFAGKRTPFTDAFYDDINNIALTRGTGVAKPLLDYLDLPILKSIDPAWANEKMHIKSGKDFPGTLGQSLDKVADIYPDNIIIGAKSSGQGPISLAEKIALHEPTHAGQDLSGIRDNTDSDYYDKFLSEILSGVIPNSIPHSDLLNKKGIEIANAIDKFDFKFPTGQVYPARIDDAPELLDYIAYYMHPLEKEARASEDMITKPLSERAKQYLGGIDSTPNRLPYDSHLSLTKMLHDLFVTEKTSMPFIVKKP